MSSSTATDQLPDLSKTYGAAFIGLLVTCFLSGIMTLQAYIFFQNSQKDKIYLKLLVLTVWIIDMVHLGGISEFVYHFVIANWGNQSIIGRSTWTLGLEEMLNTWITFLVQMFLIYRISVLSKFNKWTLTPLWLLAFIQLGFGTGGGIKSMLPQSVAALKSTRWRASIWLISGAVNDILIASILSYYLWSQRTVMSSRVVDKLIAYAINTGMLTSILAFIDIGLFISMPGNYIHLAFNFVLGRIYTNSLLASLNMRHTLRQQSTTYRKSSTGHYTTPIEVNPIRLRMSNNETSFSDGKMETYALQGAERNNSSGTIPVAPMEFAKNTGEAV